MKIKDGFVLRKVGKEQVVVAIGPAAALLNGLIKLNDSGVALWQALEHGADKQELANVLVEKYAVSQEQAEQDVNAFLAPLLQLGCIE